MIVTQEQFLSEEQEAPTINAQFSKVLKTFGSQNYTILEPIWDHRVCWIILFLKSTIYGGASIETLTPDPLITNQLSF